MVYGNFQSLWCDMKALEIREVSPKNHTDIEGAQVSWELYI